MCSTARLSHSIRRKWRRSGGLLSTLDGNAWIRFAQRANEAEWRCEALRRYDRYPQGHLASSASDH